MSGHRYCYTAGGGSGAAFLGVLKLDGGNYKLTSQKIENEATDMKLRCSSGGSGDAYHSGGGGGGVTIWFDGKGASTHSSLVEYLSDRIPPENYTYTYNGTKDHNGVIVCASGNSGSGGYHQERYSSDSSGAKPPQSKKVSENGVYLDGKLMVKEVIYEKDNVIFLKNSKDATVNSKFSSYGLTTWNAFKESYLFGNVTKIFGIDSKKTGQNILSKIKNAGAGGGAHSQGHKSKWVESSGNSGVLLIRLRMVPVKYRTFNGKDSRVYIKHPVRWNINFPDFKTELSGITGASEEADAYSKICGWVGFTQSTSTYKASYSSSNIKSFSNVTLTAATVVYGSIQRQKYSEDPFDSYGKITDNLNRSISYTADGATSTVSVSPSSPAASILHRITIPSSSPYAFVTKIKIKPQVPLTCTFNAGAKLKTGEYTTITNPYPDSAYDSTQAAGSATLYYSNSATLYVRNNISYLDTRNNTSGTTSITKSVTINGVGFFSGSDTEHTIDFGAEALAEDSDLKYCNANTTSIDFLINESTTGVTFNSLQVFVDTRRP